MRSAVETDGDLGEDQADTEREEKGGKDFVNAAFVEVGEFAAEGFAGASEEAGVFREGSAGLAVAFAPEDEAGEEREKDEGVTAEEKPLHALP